MLCPTCETLDFSFVGYRKGPDPYQVPSLPENDGSLIDIIERNDTCDFCACVAHVFQEWASKTWGGRNNLDLRDSKVRFSEQYFREKSGSIDRALKAINVDILTRSPDHPDSDNEFYWMGLTHLFQFSPQYPLNVVELCNRIEDGLHDDQVPPMWLDMEPYAGRVRPEQVDCRLLKQWNRSCRRTHGEACSHLAIYHGRNPETIRLIDAETMSIVTISSESVRWVALSYVWGSRKWNWLVEDSLQRYGQPGALAGDWLPATIADAIEVTRQIGEKYLWTDSLCIIQDSPEDKAIFIPMMDVIYGMATITIVALVGGDVFNGLPGVQVGSRSPPENPIELRGSYLVAFPPLAAAGFGDVQLI